MAGTKWVKDRRGAVLFRLFAWLNKQAHLDQGKVARAMKIVSEKTMTMDAAGEMTIWTGPTNLALTGEEGTDEDLRRIMSNRLR